MYIFATNLEYVKITLYSKFYLIAFVLGMLATSASDGIAQTNSPKSVTREKGKVYMYWGWNRGWYTKSRIHFDGNDYDFTLDEVIAKDRQSKFSFNDYFNPGRITIPQYNFRIGYMVNSHWDISIGADHMKYVVQQSQSVNISGRIANSNTLYDGTYQEDDIIVQKGFLEFEHTDGLNYENLEIRRWDGLLKKDKIKLSLNEGLGIGAMVPRTNTTLLNKARYDEFHLAGFGASAVGALNLMFFNVLFVQTEFKVGYINMPNIRTTIHKSDHADQDFLFAQWNVVFGAMLDLNRFAKK
jgi:hypothetical protein